MPYAFAPRAVLETAAFVVRDLAREAPAPGGPACHERIDVEAVSRDAVDLISGVEFVHDPGVGNGRHGDQGGQAAHCAACVRTSSAARTRATRLSTTGRVLVARP